MLQPFFKRVAHAFAQEVVPCHRARMGDELDAIARLRYEVQVREHNVALPEAGGDANRLWYPEDELETTTHFYAGSRALMQGCLRIRAWKPGEVPPDAWSFYSMDVLPGLEALAVCDVSKLMVVPSRRGTMAMSALSSYSLYETVVAHQNHLMFACCAPGLLRAYRALGMRTFGGRPRHTPLGLVIPVIGLTNDLEHVRRLGSPWFRALARLDKERRLPKDLPRYRQIAEQDRSAIVDPALVLEELSAFARTGSSRFLGALDPEALRALAPFGLILQVPADVCLTRLGVVEQEVFIALEGQYAVRRDDVQLRAMGPGDLFGEIALLSENGRRTAEVRSTTSGRVLVLRRRFLREISTARPKIAVALYGALVHELLNRGVAHSDLVSATDAGARPL